MDVVSTFMPAHVAKQIRKAENEFIQLCIDEMMPYVKEHELAEFIDIFTEDFCVRCGAEPQISGGGERSGISGIHADEIKPSAAAYWRGEIGATSAEQLSVIDDAMASMARGGTIAMHAWRLRFIWGATFAARRMIDEFEIPGWLWRQISTGFLSIAEFTICDEPSAISNTG